MSENQFGGETKNENKFQKVKEYFPHMRLMAFGAILVLGLAIAAYSLMDKKNSVEEQKAISAAEFGIAEVVPQNMALDTGSEIKLIFNNVVSAHHVQEFIQVVPFYDVDWQQGSTSNEIIYRPPYGFYPGSSVKVTLLAGLPSDAGKKLDSNLTLDFNVKLEGNAMQFSKGRDAYRVMTFTEADGLEVSAAYGISVAEPTASLFQVPNEQAFLQDMVYKRTQVSLGYESKEDYISGIVYEKYEYKKIDTANYKFIKNFKLKDSVQIKEQLPVGMYLLVGSDISGALTHSWIFINKTGVIFKQDDQKIVLAAQDFTSKSAVSALPVTYYRMDEKVTQIGTGTINNIQEIPRNLNNRIDLIMAKRGEEYMYVPLYLPGSAAEIRSLQDMKQQFTAFLTTDRPIYKPGDTVNYRAVVRIYNDNNYLIPPVNTEVVFENGLNQKETKTTNASGIISGSFIIPTNIELYSEFENMRYMDVADRRGNYIGGNGYEVAKYTKPDFDVTVDYNQVEFTKNDKVRATIKATTLTGQPVQNKEITYRVFIRDFYETEKAVFSESFRLNEWGGMCGGGFGYWDEYYGEEIMTGTIRTDSTGQAVIDYDTSKDLKAIISQEVTIQVEALDSSNNTIKGARTAVVKAGNLNVFINNRRFEVESGQEFILPFTAETRAGEKVLNKDFDYRIYKSGWDESAQKSIQNNIKTGVVRTDGRGYGYISDSIDKSTTEFDGAYYLEVSTLDSNGNRVGDARYLEVYPVGGNPYDESLLEISSEQNNYVSGDEMILRIKSPEDIKAMITFERGRIYDAAWLDVKKGESLYKFPVKNEYTPSITPTLTLFYKNTYSVEGLQLNVPAMGKLLNVTVTSDKASYLPGETAIVTIRTTNANNQPVQATVGAAVVDKAIYVLRKRANPAIHSYFYPSRPRNINTSSSMIGVKFFGGDGGGGGGGGGGTASKLVDTIYWNPNLQTDANGVVTIEVPATEYLTTWRVVTYATTSSTEVGQTEYDYIVKR